MNIVVLKLHKFKTLTINVLLCLNKKPTLRFLSRTIFVSLDRIIENMLLI